jgi:hypothetical protein
MQTPAVLVELMNFAAATIARSSRELVFPSSETVVLESWCMAPATPAQMVSAVMTELSAPTLKVTAYCQEAFALKTRNCQDD